MDPDLFPDQPSGQGAPPPTIANVRHLLDGNGIVARYNVIKKKTEIVIPDLPGVADNSDSVAIAHVKSVLALHCLQNGDARAICDAIANGNPYNPAADWIESKPWDLQDRLPAFYATLTTADDYPTQLKNALIYHWLLSAVAAALMPADFSTRLVLVLQGPQSIGKTRWCLSLVSDPSLRSALVKSDHHFDGGNKDGIIGAIRFWIVEMGELESSLRRDKERLKGILTRDTDVIRLPYAAAESEFPRRTVFLATANSSDFLTDDTGSTRWGIIPVTAIDYAHGIDMQQVFAQLAVDFHARKPWWLDRETETMLETWNERHRATSIVRDHLTAHIDFEGDQTIRHQRYTASEVLMAAGIEHPTQAQARECGQILRSKFGPPKKIRRISKWELPLRDDGIGHKPAIDPLPARKSKFD